MEKDQPEMMESRANLDRKLALLAYAYNASEPKHPGSNNKIEQFDGASSDNINQEHEVSADDPDLNDIEQADQAPLEDLNQGHEDAAEEPQIGDIEQAYQASLEALNQGHEDAPEEPQIGDIEQADQASLEALNQGHEDAPDEPVSGDTEQPNQKPPEDSSGRWPVYDIKQYFGDQKQENASSAIEINVKDKAISVENVEEQPFEDHKKMPDTVSTTTSEDLQDFIEVMNDGPVESLLEDLNQSQSSEKKLSTAEEGDVCSDSDMKTSAKDVQKPQENSDCEEGEVLSDDNDDDASFYNSGKGDIRHSTPFTKENNYQMFEKKQLPMPKLRDACNFLMGLQHMPHAFMPGMHQTDADPFYSQPRAHMRIGPLLPTPLFNKSLPFDLADAPNRKETFTRKTTETVGTSISWQSVEGDTNSFSSTKETEGSCPSNSGKKSISGDSSPLTLKRTRSPPVTLKRSRSRCLSPSVSPPRYGYSKRRRCRSRRTSRRTVSPNSSSSPSPPRSPKRNPGRRLTHRTAVSPCPRKIHPSLSPRKSPIRAESRYPGNPIRRRSRSPPIRRRSRSPFVRRRSRSPPIRRRSPNASKQSRGLVRPKLMNYAAEEPPNPNSTPMSPRKRKISTSSNSSCNTTDDSTSSTDSSIKRSVRRRKTPKKGPKTPTDSPPPEDGTKARKKFLQAELLRLNEKIEAAKKMRQMKMMKLSSNSDPRYKS